jgi:hypothetical protein
MIDWDEQGNGTLYQGDTGSLPIVNLDPSQEYIFFFAVQDERRNFIGEEISVTTQGMTEIEIFIPKELTDLLIVPTKEEYKDYYYTIKACKPATGTSPQTEDTVFVNGATFGVKRRLRVYPKGAEGLK